MTQETGLSLAEALARAQPTPDGTRLARSLPNGDLLAVQHRSRPPRIRKMWDVPRQWLPAGDVAPGHSWEPI